MRSKVIERLMAKMTEEHKEKADRYAESLIKEGMKEEYYYMQKEIRMLKYKKTQNSIIWAIIGYIFGSIMTSLIF